MFCVKCGNQVPEDGRFCPKCGTPVRGAGVPHPTDGPGMQQTAPPRSERQAAPPPPQDRTASAQQKKPASSSKLNWGKVLSNYVDMASQNADLGILGAIAYTRMQDKVEEKKNRPKPGMFCAGVCEVRDDRCQACLQMQQRFTNDIEALRRMEDSKDLSTAEAQKILQSQAITECIRCGASYRQGATVCPYCGQEYPRNAYTFDMPVSQSARIDEYLKKIDTTWNEDMVPLIAYQAQMMQEVSEGGITGMMQKLMGKATGAMQSQLKHTVKEIMAGAEYYRVPVSIYIAGVKTDQYEMQKGRLLQEYNRAEEARQRQQRDAAAQKLAEQQKRSSYTAGDWMQRRSENSFNSTRYTSDVCNNCLHWNGAGASSGSFFCTEKGCNTDSWDTCTSHSRFG